MTDFDGYSLWYSPTDGTNVQCDVGDNRDSDRIRKLQQSTMSMTIWVRATWYAMHRVTESLISSESYL